ncbi:branched-chain amino acid ABC transporter permease [Rhodoligotrophos defluvii]|uniref:branched-chain amino acid ABC transporter permease n=1 Tax=Rhodoligotrophos defluvii TaxID=2561934 RepID=UPI0010C9DE7A|nr:branched-chain amino acid ABC transporter permease [Rhodoligotrophos defluvii]
MVDAPREDLNALARSASSWPPLRVASLVLFAAALAFGLIAHASGASFYLRLATEALIFGGLALSVDLLLGRTGMLTLGQALYFGVGAYVSALVLKDVSPSFWLAMAAAVCASAVAGVIGGLIAVRSRGVYFALITFGLAQVVAKIVYNTRALGASDGIIGIPIIDINFGLFTINAADPLGFFLVALVLLSALYLAIAWLLNTPHGRVLAAIRANEARARFLGYETRRYKLGAYIAAASLAGLAGALYPMLRGFVSPELMFFQTSAWAIIAVIIGGTGTLVGALLGSFLLTFLRSVLGSYTEHAHIAVGILFVIAVIAFPKGILGVLDRLAKGKSGEAK